MKLRDLIESSSTKNITWDSMIKLWDNQKYDTFAELWGSISPELHSKIFQYLVHIPGSWERYLYRLVKLTNYKLQEKDIEHLAWLFKSTSFTAKPASTKKQLSKDFSITFPKSEIKILLQIPSDLEKMNDNALHGDIDEKLFKKEAARFIINNVDRVIKLSDKKSTLTNYINAVDGETRFKEILSAATPALRDKMKGVLAPYK